MKITDLPGGFPSCLDSVWQVQSKLLVLFVFYMFLLFIIYYRITVIPFKQYIGLSSLDEHTHRILYEHTTTKTLMQN